MKKKKILVASLAIALVVAFSFTLIGCFNRKPTVKVPVTKMPANSVLKSSEEVMGFSAVTSVGMMSEMKGVSANAGGELNFADAAAPAPVDPSKPDLEIVNKYMNIFDSLLSDAPIKTEETTSDRTEYTKMVKYTIKDIDGTSKTFTIYYNQSLDTTPIVPEEEEEGEVSTEIVTTEVFKIDGIMVQGVKEFKITGSLVNETEKEGEELETSSELELTTKTDDANYVTIKQEIEKETEAGVTEEEVEYVYTVVTNGKIVHESVIEMEYEDATAEKKETEIKMHYTDNGVVKSYKFQKETTATGSEIEVVYLEGEKTGSFKVVVTKDANGKDVYQYKIGTEEITMDKHDLDD
ncbi:MAG: hypothetical protein RR374_06355 [Clostridia bacterium]